MGRCRTFPPGHLVHAFGEPVLAQIMFEHGIAVMTCCQVSTFRGRVNTYSRSREAAVDAY